MASFENAPSVASRTIEDFKATLIGGAARPNLFEVQINFPTVIDIADQVKKDIRFLVKAAALPASNINVIEVPFRGRNFKIAGDRTFDVWTITVINDQNFQIRNSFEQWMNVINKHDNATGVVDPTEYQTNARVMQLGRSRPKLAAGKGTEDNTGSQVPVLKAYDLFGVFPTNVSSIELSYDSSDTIEEFTVDLQVQWWDALDAEANSILDTNENAATFAGDDTGNPFQV